MAETPEALIVRLEASQAKFEKQLDAMNKKADDTAAKVERTFLAMNERVGKGLDFGRDAFRGLLSTAAPAALAVFGVEGAFDAAKSALERFARIAEQSEQAGLNPEFFQAVGQRAAQSGSSFDAAAQALVSFNRAAGLAESGQGRMLTQLTRLDPELAKQIQLAGTQEQRVRLVADALDRTTDSSKKAAIAAAAFGPAGAQLVATFEGGSKALDAFEAKARNIGLIIDGNLVENSKELNTQFQVASQTIGNEFGKALVELAPLLIQTAKSIAAVGQAINFVIQSMTPLEQKSMGALKTQLSDIDDALAAAKKTIVPITADPNSDLPFGGALDKLIGDAKIAHGQGFMGGNVPQLEKERAAVQAQIDALQKQMDADNKPAASGSGGFTGTVSDADAARKKIDEVTKSLHLQLAALTETDRQKAIDTALSRANVDANSAAGEKIKALAGEVYDGQKAFESITTAENFFADGLATAFDSLLPKIKSGNDALDNFLNSLIEAAAQAALLGQGPLAGILGTAPAKSGTTGGILGSVLGALIHGFADGTPSAPGGLARINERGGEIVNLPSGAQVIPHDISQQLAGSRQSATHVTVGVSVDDQGNLQAYVRNVARGEAAAAGRAAVATSRKSLPAWQRDYQQNGA